MLRLGRCYPGKTTWGPAHMKWLMPQKLEHREQRMAREELLHRIRQEAERVCATQRLTTDQLKAIVKSWRGDRCPKMVRNRQKSRANQTRHGQRQLRHAGV